MVRIQDIGVFNEVREAGLARLMPTIPRITVGMGTCGRGNGAEGLYQALATEIDQTGMDVVLAPVGCFGACFCEPLAAVRLPNSPLVFLRGAQATDAGRIVHDVSTGNLTPDLVYCKVQEWDHVTSHVRYGTGFPEVPSWDEVPFFRGQKKLVLRNCGFINPDDIEEYFGVGGYQALYKVLIDGRRDAVIEQLKAAKLRGRGGAGYLTGIKWEFLAKAVADRKYVICNADEGDPGAYMNRNEIESDPHSLLEGMIIGGYVMGASEGIVYIRAEYPLAVHRLERAIDQAREYGMLGENIFGRGFNFDLHVVEGAGAFVCGEETALIASLEGHAGRPRPRPPYPAQKGLWGRPTNINNVETWYNVAPIVTRGATWFTQTGSAKSSGTKVISLVGKVQNTGLVEMPLGTPLKTFIYDIGGGGAGGRQIKAVQTGGPSGGCIPQEMFDTPVDYESLAKLGSIMGSGGMVVMDDDNCMVDVARFFIEFTHSESCGKCIPCRVGLNKSLRILNRVTEGAGTARHLELLDELGRYMRDCSLCGLGQSAPNPVLTTLRHFRNDFEDHIVARRCAAGVCEELALSPCENSCPLHMNVPRFLQLWQEQRLEDAFEAIVMENPLPASTGRVCQHPCENRCRRRTVDAAVNMREIHRFVADSVLLDGGFDAMVERILARQLDRTGRKIAVVGAGPAGLTAAFYLSMLGHEVTVFERQSAAGGMLRFAIPEYRLPKSVLAREIELIERTGVGFVFDTSVGKDVSLTELEDRYDAVFVSIGTWVEPQSAEQGAQLRGVHSALHFLEATARGEDVALGARVAIVGGGNAAIDAARTVVRKGREATVLYRRERKDMPAIAEETLAALKEGVKFVFLAAPHRIVGDDAGNVKAIEVARTKLGEFDASGRRRPVATAEIHRIDCDAVIFAVGESADGEIARAAGIRAEDGSSQVHRFTLATNRPRFYAGGDVVTGASNVSSAMALGKRAAASIDRQLMESDRWKLIQPEIAYGQKPPADPEPSPRRRSHEIEPAVRATSDVEVVTGLTPEESLDEAKRCLRCDLSVVNET
ncbi:MAG TPA: NADH-ubiquinone oxidoreductase-F iron-sulfur binding region domain-containing protein [Thermoanaerobaculia bacterium]